MGLQDVEKILSIRRAQPDAAQPHQDSEPEAGQSDAVSGSSRSPPCELLLKDEDTAYVHTYWRHQQVVAAAAQHYPGLKQRLRQFLQRVEDAGGVDGWPEHQEEQGLEDGIDPAWLEPDRVICQETDRCALLVAGCASTHVPSLCCVVLQCWVPCLILQVYLVF